MNAETKFRKGDTVSMTLVVESFFGTGDVRLRQPGEYTDIYAKARDLEMVKPAFDIGDRVTWCNYDGTDTYVGDVLFVAEDHLWVSRGNGEYATVWTGKAMRVDAEPTREDEAA
jgi:hypothetical protein